MSTQTFREALPYQAPQPQRSDLFWSIFKIALIVWGATTLCRHTIYWGGGILGAVGLGRMEMIPSLLFALTECVLLVLILVNAATLKADSRNHHASLAGLCLAFVAVSVAGFAFENFSFALTSVRAPMQYAPQLLWRALTRAQFLIVPGTAIVAFARWRKP